MRNATLAVVAVMGVVGLSGTMASGQAGRGGAGAAPSAPAPPNLATDKTMFWPAAEIDARWKENERLKRANVRLFNGPTNISANVRIVPGEDPPLTHETTMDMWIVTAGTAVARTDGQLVGTGATAKINNATVRTMHVGDVLVVPPGIPHHFTEMKGFRAWLMRADTKGLVRTGPAPTPPARGAAPAAAAAAPAAARGRGAAAPPVPDLATDKTMFWTAADIDGRWKDNEATGRTNSRIFSGPATVQANVRIVAPDDDPLTHNDGTADVWLVTAGEAMARTDGQVVETNGKRTISNGMVRPVHTGDLLYVPPGVPHYFTDLKGFRAWLIRFEVTGWRQSIQPAAGRGAAR